MGEEWSSEAIELREFIFSYKHCKAQMKLLEKRRRDILADFSASPLSAVVSDGMPRGSSEPVGAASLTLKLDAIDTKIAQQVHHMRERLEDIMALIELLPEASEERMIIEQRAFDQRPMEVVADFASMSTKTGYRVFHRAIDKLLTYSETQTIIAKYRHI